MDIKIQDGKLHFQDGKLFLTEDYESSVAQRLYIRLKSNYGRWFWNEQYGVDWYGKIFGKVKNKTRIDLLIKEVILLEKYVEYIISFQSRVDNVTRVYSCEFSVKIKKSNKIENYVVITTQDGFKLMTDTDRFITTKL